MILIADSGSTKADWKIIKSNGDIGSQSTRGFNPFFQDSETIEAALLKDFTEDLNKSAVTRVYYYGAGCSDEYRNSIVHKALANVFPNAVVNVDHDLLASARALCYGSAGIACILGTGSNSCLFDGKKIVDNVTNIGSLLGDEGSGSHIGKALLRGYFYREMPDELRKEFEAVYPGGKREILDKVYGNPTPNVYLASFAKFMSDRKDHLYIQKIVFDCFEEFVVRHIQKYDGHIHLPVHFVGSIAYYFKDILKLALEIHDLQLGIIIKKPIDNLVKFHMKVVS